MSFADVATLSASAFKAAYAAIVPSSAIKIELLEALARLIVLLEKYAAQWRRRPASTTLHRLTALRRVLLQVVCLRGKLLMGKRILRCLVQNRSHFHDFTSLLWTPETEGRCGSVGCDRDEGSEGAACAQCTAAAADVVADRHAFKNDMNLLCEAASDLAREVGVVEALSSTLGMSVDELTAQIAHVRLRIESQSTDSPTTAAGHRLAACARARAAVGASAPTERAREQGADRAGARGSSAASEAAALPCACPCACNCICVGSAADADRFVTCFEND